MCSTRTANKGHFTPELYILPQHACYCINSATWPFFAFLTVWSPAALNIPAVCCIYTHTELRKQFHQQVSILYVTPFLVEISVITVSVLILGFWVRVYCTKTILWFHFCQRNQSRLSSRRRVVQPAVKSCDFVMCKRMNDHITLI